MNILNLSDDIIGMIIDKLIYLRKDKMITEFKSHIRSVYDILHDTEDIHPGRRFLYIKKRLEKRLEKHYDLNGVIDFPYPLPKNVSEYDLDRLPSIEKLFPDINQINIYGIRDESAYLSYSEQEIEERAKINGFKILNQIVNSVPFNRHNKRDKQWKNFDMREKINYMIKTDI